MKTTQKLQCLCVLGTVLFVIHFISNNQHLKNLELHQKRRELDVNNEKLKSDSQNTVNKNSGHYKGNSGIYGGITMSEYMRSYNLTTDIHYSCPNTEWPKPQDIIWRKNTYQKVVLQFAGQQPSNLFGMKFYFDDRFLRETGERHIRGIVAIQGPGNFKHADQSAPVFKWVAAMNSFPWSVLLWYKDFKDPVGVRCRIQAAGGLNRNVSNQYYFQETITCVVPEMGVLPVSASVVTHPCARPTSNMEIVYPAPDPTPSHREIGVCMASFFGNLTSKDVPYFVNWMEALRTLGVKEVSVNNGSVKFTDDKIKKAFQYYQDIGRLTLTHYPPIHMTWVSPDQDDDVTEAVNKLTTGDCVYRNLKRYWYVLIIDMDELPVPTYFDTYQEYLSDFTLKHPNLTHAHCLTIRSSFFYREQEAGNPHYGEHLPILRLTKRFRPEPINVDGIGISKSFHNMRNMVAAGHHITRQSHWGGGEKKLLRPFLPMEDILIHHYRAHCKYSGFCRDSWNETIHDDIIPRKFGKQLQTNIENVLTDIGYHF